jgi:hypothetical protein
MSDNYDNLSDDELIALAKYKKHGAEGMSDDELVLAAKHLTTPKSSGTAAFGKASVENLLPTAGGIAGMMGAVSVGSPLISAATAVNPALGLATGLGVGIAGGFGGSALVNEAQNKVMSYVPDSLKEAAGFGKEQRALEQAQHPDLSFAGGLAPSLLAFRPGTVAPLLDKAGKVIASAGTQRAAMAGMGAGIEAGTELIQNGEINPKHVAMAGAFQGIAATPTSLAKKAFPSLRTEPAVSKTKVENIIKDAKQEAENAKPPLAIGNDVAKEVRSSPEAEALAKAKAEETMAATEANIASEERQKTAQQVLDERQAALQQEVHTQATRDLSVAERARQESAGWPTTHTDTTPSVSPEPVHPVVAAAEKKLEAAQEKVIAVQEKVANGDASPVALKQAQAAVARAEKTVTAAKVNLNKNPNKLKGQRGAIWVGSTKTEPKIDFSKKAETEQVNKTLGDILPELSRDAHTPDEVIAQAQNTPDIDERSLLGSKTIGKAVGMFTKGFLFEKLKTNNVIQKFAHNRLSDAVDASTVQTKQLIDEKLAPAWREMSRNEKTEVSSVLISAMKEKVELSPEILRANGFTETQITAVTALKEVHKSNFESLNKARAAAGKPPVEPYIGYVLGMADGNFKRLFYKEIIDASGNVTKEVVGIIGSNFRKTLDRRVTRILEAHPEWKATDEKYNGVHSRKQKGDSLQEALMLLSDNNPNIAEFGKALEADLTNETYNSLGGAKHAKGKKGIEGMQGDKPWLEGERTWYGKKKTAEDIAHENADDFMDIQVRGTQVMSKWAHLSEAALDINKVLSEPSIQQSQKRAIESTREYLENAMGKNPSKSGQQLDNWIGQMGDAAGIGPGALRGSIHNIRAATNAMFFTINPSYWLANMLQPEMSMPIIKAYMKQKGLDVNIDPTGWSDLVTKGLWSGLKYKAAPAFGIKLDKFDTAMWDYGKAHGQVSGQLIVESPHTNKGFGHYKSQVLDAPVGAAIEGAPRAAVYATMSHMLKQAGFENDPQLFPMARQLTDLAMGDYRHHEQAKVHNTMGMFGGITRNLTSYPLHQKGLITLLAREWKDNGQYKAFGAALAATFAFAGVKGMYGYQDANFAVTHLSGLWGKPTTLDKEVLDYADDLNKKHPENNAGDMFAMGAAAFAGIDLSGSMGQGFHMPGMTGGMGKPYDVGEAAMDLATNPSEWNAKQLIKEAGGKPTQIAMQHMGMLTQTSPNGEERVLNKKGKTTVTLNEVDKTARSLGFRGSNESRLSTQNYAQNRADKFYTDAQTSIVNNLTEEMANSHGKLPSGYVEKQMQKYVEYEGTPDKYLKAITDAGINLNTDERQRLLLKYSNGGLAGAYKLKRRAQ